MLDRILNIFSSPNIQMYSTYNLPGKKHDNPTQTYLCGVNHRR